MKVPRSPKCLWLHWRFASDTFRRFQDRSKARRKPFAPLNVKSNAAGSIKRRWRRISRGAKRRGERNGEAMKKLVEGLRVGRTKRLAANIARNTVIAANISRKVPAPKACLPPGNLLTPTLFRPSPFPSLAKGLRAISSASHLVSPLMHASRFATRTDDSPQINPWRRRARDHERNSSGCLKNFVLIFSKNPRTLLRSSFR